VAERLVTVQEVINEVRDKQSRAFLASLPFGIDVQEPSEESLKAGAQCCELGLFCLHAAIALLTIFLLPLF
jgi:rRNA maturation endonuclease Nob1